MICTAPHALATLSLAVGLVSTFVLPNEEILNAVVAANIDQPPRPGSLVPGNSLVRYNSDPTFDLFQIERLDIIPNPCIFGYHCGVVIRGRFTETLSDTLPHISYNVTNDYPYFDIPGFGGEDDFCDWVNIEELDVVRGLRGHLPRISSPKLDGSHPQAGDQMAFQRHHRVLKKSCPPGAGQAAIVASIDFSWGYLPEANYTVDVKATAEGEEGPTIFDLRLEMEMKY